LVEALAEVSVLAYPNCFPETSCIAVMEAMASGCQVVTSDLGALPETTAGFARLVGFDQGWKLFQVGFFCTMLKALEERRSPEKEALLREQVDFVAEHYTWSSRATEWVDWIGRLQARRAT
jgi:glycosyltransferase involved in cell wall biosynthesis